MNSILWATLGVAIGALGPILYLQWRRRLDGAGDTARTAAVPHRPSPAPSRQPAPAGSLKRQLVRKFHGVTLKPGPHACAAVQALAGQRFLPHEAPTTPLPGCDQAKCLCGYGHHGDRRDREDRRTGWGTFGGFTPSLPEGNRRGQRRDRRARAAPPR
jgi:hypothetical protein